jgi:AcrR family transcriptional regulator
MGVAERKERHKEELKGEILKAAKELYMEKGLEATSIRNIAEKIEYSPATVYLYFRDKDEIMHALHQEGFKILVEYFTDALKISDPFERLKAMGEGYIRFSMERPEMYKLAFVMEEPIAHLEHCEDEWDEGEGAYNVLLHTVEACQQVGYFPGLEAHGVSFMIWSTMHGLCSLRGSGHLGHVCEATKVRPDVDALMQYTFETFIKFLETFKK